MNIKLLLASLGLSLTQLSFASYDLSSVNIPEEARPQIDKSLITEQMQEIQEKGYIERNSLKYEYLNGIESRINYEAQGKVKSTHLRKSLAEIFAVPSLKTVPSTVKKTTLGFAPVGTFDPNAGWTGITEIFKSNDIGICQFSHFDLKAGNGAYSLSKDNDRRDVNGKYTYVEVTGKENEGFDYKVAWFEELNMYTLSCINKAFSKDFIQQVINLAQQIDRG
ncbi:hypothetical protein ACFORL_06975 [Legionella dresdenensis]|uniref:Uncharacterized protein n=1 Tax=Legionella dresdenensis TaxID=450200 RepID=A0ABV8CEU0_9GAMM